MLAFEANYREIRQRLYNPAPKVVIPEPEPETPTVPAMTQEQIDQGRKEREAALVEVWQNVVRPETVPIPVTGLTVGLIVHVAKMHFGITEVELLSRCRSQPRVHMRQIIMYVARRNTTLSFPQIGRRLGRMDHTTVLHGVRQIAKYLAAGDPAITHDVAHIENILGIR